MPGTKEIIKSNLKEKLFPIFFILILNSCVTTYSPGNPEYAWLNGRWEGTSSAGPKGSSGGRPFRLELKVVNRDEIIGRVARYRDVRRIGTFWAYDGVVLGGTINSGEKMRINLEVLWVGSGGTTSRYQLIYYPEDQSFRSRIIYLIKRGPIP